MMSGRWLVATFLGVLMCFAASEAAAKDKVVYKKKTRLDLTGAVIEGELTKPEGSYIVNRKVSRFSSMLLLRKDFKPELRASADAF